MVMSVRGVASSMPHSDDANAARCMVDYKPDLDPLAFGYNSDHSAFPGNFSGLRFELPTFGAELCHKVLKLDPICYTECRPVLGCVAIKCDRVSTWTNGNALQNSILSFLRDLCRLDLGGLLQKLRGN